MITDSAEEKNMKDATDEALAESNGNITDEHHLSTTDDRVLAAEKPIKTLNITGLEDIPTSMVAMPYVRLIQPSSKKTEMSNGKECPAGSFLFNDTLTAFETLDFILLRAKPEVKIVDEHGNYVDQTYQGKKTLKRQLSLLGVQRETDKIFIISLSVTAFSSWGKLLARFKDIDVHESWRFVINTTTEKRENDKGKYWVPVFKLGKELSEDEVLHLQELYLEYGGTLERQVTEVADE